MPRQWGKTWQFASARSPGTVKRQELPRHRHLQRYQATPRSQESPARLRKPTQVSPLARPLGENVFLIDCFAMMSEAARDAQGSPWTFPGIPEGNPQEPPRNPQEL